MAVVRSSGGRYVPTWRAMQDFPRGAQPIHRTRYGCWSIRGLYPGAGRKPEHLIAAPDSRRPDRPRRAITYHGRDSGGLVLVDLRRRGYGIRELVARLEQAVIDLLAAQGVAAARLAGAPACMPRRQDRRARPAREARLHLPRAGAQRRHGPGAVRRLIPALRSMRRRNAATSVWNYPFPTRAALSRYLLSAIYA